MVFEANKSTAAVHHETPGTLNTDVAAAIQPGIRLRDQLFVPE